MGTRPHVHCTFFGGKSEENHLLRFNFVKVFKIQPQNTVFPHRIKINYPKPSILVPRLGQCFKRVRKKTYQDLTIRTAI